MRIEFDLPVAAVEARVEAIRDLLAQDLSRAVRRTADSLQTRLRGQVAGAGLGPGLARAWSKSDYPSGGRYSLHPAALVASKSKVLHAAFATGGTIRARGGRWLAIPTAEAIRMGYGEALQARPGAVRPKLGGAARPRRFAQTRRARADFGDELRFVPISSTRAMIVLSGGSHGGIAGRDVVLFNLVRSTRLRARLDLGAAAEATRGEFVAAVKQAIGGGG